MTGVNGNKCARPAHAEAGWAAVSSTNLQATRYGCWKALTTSIAKTWLIFLGVSYTTKRWCCKTKRRFGKRFRKADGQIASSQRTTNA